MADLPTLIAKRGVVKGRVTRISNSLKDNTYDSVSILQDKISQLKTINHEFYEVHTSIIVAIETSKSITDKDKQNEDAEKYAKEFDENYEKVLSDHYKLIDKLIAPTAVVQDNTAASGNQDLNIRLPTIELPSFSGSYSDWLPFFETFNCLVNNNSSLNNIQKFHYLKSCLRNEASKVVESLTISADNYNTALQLLEARFQNMRLIVDEHIRTIIDFPNLVKPSCSDLRKLIDTLKTNVAALCALKQPVEHWDAILITITFDKLDYQAKKEWQAQLNCELPKYSEFISFLEKRYQFLESITGKFNSSQQQKSHQSNNQKQFRAKASAINVTHKLSCYFCTKPHLIYKCDDFLKLTPVDRFNNIRKLNLCTNCLKPNHEVKDCRANGCRVCNKMHNSLLHFDNKNDEPEVVPSLPSTSATSSATAISTCGSLHNCEILLPTAMVLVEDSQGKFVDIRILMDNGAQSNLMTESLVKKLNLTPKSINHPIVGVGHNVMNVKHLVNITMKSRLNSFSATFDCLVLPQITHNLPLQSVYKNKINIPDDIELADPHFFQSRPVDLLVSSELFWQLLCYDETPVKSKNSNLAFYKTHLGWVATGPLSDQKAKFHKTVCNFVQSYDDVHALVNNFWEIEESKITNSLDRLKAHERAPDACNKFFLETHRRGPDNKFVVKLLFKEETGPDLGLSKDGAIKRLRCLEQKFHKNKQLKADYSKFIKEYIDLGHMERIDENNDESRRQYLPHHCVIKESSISTRIRVVFDGSYKTTNGKSLNDNLLTGNKLQQDLFDILCRFRTYKYVLTADIAKMFRQVWVHPDHRMYQNILWRNDITKEIETYQLNTVTYGMACSSYLAVRCLQQLAHENMAQFPEACKIIINEFYMDDAIFGVTSEEKGLELRDQLIQILSGGGFELCKWASNNPALLPEDEITSLSKDCIVKLDPDSDTKTLGLLWNCKFDDLRYQMEDKFPVNQILTKRIILSRIAQIYDPLGLTGPVIVIAKIILQDLWKLKLEWDEPVPESIAKLWNQFQSDLVNLSHLRIPRLVICEVPVRCELHGFCDASLKSYGCAIYLRSIDKDGNCKSELLCSKSRVSPLKVISLPRLELCGALVLARLAHSVLDKLNLKMDNSYFWTDSTIVLAWLSKDSSHWKQFVANRVSEIQSLTNVNNWSHVKGEENPADIISRGMLPAALAQSTMWFHGPPWLHDNSEITIDNDKLKNKSVAQLESEIPEQKTTCHVLINATDFKVLDKISKFRKMQGAIAYCLRFIHNCRNKVRNTGTLSGMELDRATTVIVKLIQIRYFPEEYQALQKGSPLNKKSKLLSLDPIFDHEQSVIRVGGRLKNSDLSYESKHPMFIPSNCHVTKVLIREEHVRLLHAGTQLTLSSLRQKYWPTAGRTTVRGVIRSCITCFRCKPVTVFPKMGDLPKARIEKPLRPFIKCGVDFCGPISLKEGNARKPRTVKAYIAVFVCFATKAVHLELVSNLTSEAFLQCLQRFTSRRGNISDIYSDNATNFVGSNRILKKMYEFTQSQNFKLGVIDELANKNIQWHFIPPRSPHMGGLWEAAVKSAKFHLKRAIGENILNFEELYTVLTRIEAILNSRPITPLSNDPNDYQPLTPGHFLIGDAITCPIDKDITDVPMNRLKRWQRVVQITQHFWQRWTRDYLNGLQGRSKWRTVSSLPKVGDMVLLKNDNAPPLTWKLGRIETLHLGKDNIPRVVQVKTPAGVVKRATRGVCVLPLEQ